MKILQVITLLVCAAAIGFAQSSDKNTQAAGQQTAAEQQSSSAASAVAAARAQVAAHPGNPEPYVSLAVALCQTAKETSDASYYAQADDMVNHALTLTPDNFEALKARVAIALGRHEFASARDLATGLNKRTPDDVSVYGYLVDANVALGDYDEAEQAAQWMLNLRPGNVPALVRAAELREVFGDPEGAIEVLRMILDSTSPADNETRGWALTQIARLDLDSGKLDAAESTLAQAMAIVPDSPDTLRNLARLRSTQLRHAAAVDLLRRADKTSAQPDTLYALAEEMESAGLKEEAQHAFAEFEREALARSRYPDNYNRELVFYFADHAHKPAEALGIAQLEIARRRDVLTLDAYAWALYGNQQYSDAWKNIDAALKVGIRQAPIFLHASQIALKVNRPADAERYQRMAAELSAAGSTEARMPASHQRPGEIAAK
jgi:tetratricopeptide (TPR) repeat protein